MPVFGKLILIRQDSIFGMCREKHACQCHFFYVAQHATVRPGRCWTLVLPWHAYRAIRR